MAKTDSVG